MQPQQRGNARLDWVVLVTWETKRAPVVKIHGKFTEAVAKKYAKHLRDTAKYFPEDIDNAPRNAVRLRSATARPIERPERGIL